MGSAAAIPLVISSLSQAQALQIAKQYGPAAVLWLLQILNQRREGRAWRQQEQTFRQMLDALPQLLNDIQRREIRVVPHAFNSAPTFLDYFQTAALGAVPLVLLSLSSAISRVGASLDAIRSELAISNVARVQGWGNDGFGAYVHRFVKNEMTVVYRTPDGADHEHHFFYVWHPDSDWYPAFEGRQTEDPLGPAFGGYHDDLATICLRMRSDRQAVITTTDYGRAAAFHLVIPAYYPLVIDRPVKFANELLPLVITGSRHRSTDLVWLSLRQKSRRLRLNYVSVLPENMNPLFVGGNLGFIGCWFGAAGCAVASITFPPCALVAGNIGASFCATGMASGAVTIAGGTYEAITQETTQVLGDPIFLGERS